MEKVAEDLGLLSQLCLMHGLHIATSKTLQGSADFSVVDYAVLNDIADIVFGPEDGDVVPSVNDEAFLEAVSTGSNPARPHHLWYESTQYYLVMIQGSAQQYSGTGSGT